MPNKKLKPLRVPLIALEILIGISLAGLAESYYERFRAQDLIASLSQIEVGSTSEVQSRQITKRFSAYSHSEEYSVSGEQFTSENFTFQNRAFRWLHLSLAKFVWISVTYANGVVVSKSAQYFEVPGYSGVVKEEVVSDSAKGRMISTNHGRNAVYNHGGFVPAQTDLCYQIYIDEDTTAPLARRQLDWQIDLSCMTKLGGCRDPRKVLRGAAHP